MEREMRLGKFELHDFADGKYENQKKKNGTLNLSLMGS
jgi:hypothetical protein